MDPTLVTGAAGHIGSRVVRALIAQGREVRASVRPGANPPSWPPGAQKVEADVLDPTALQAAVGGCRTVFHLAAEYSTDPARGEAMMKVALDGTRNLLDAVAKAGTVRRVVYTSSVAAVGHNYDPGRQLDETSWNDAPMDAYCRSKTESERLAHKLAADLGIDLIVVNPAMVIGPGDHKPTPSNLVVLEYLRNPRPVWFDQGHSIVDVDDIARGHLLAEAKGRPGERYILGGDNVELREVFESLSAMTGLARPRVKLGRGTLLAAAGALEVTARLRGNRPLLTREKAKKLHGYHSYFSSAKAERELGYEARAYGDALARAVSWFVETPGMLPERRRMKIRSVLSRVHGDDAASAGER